MGNYAVVERLRCRLPRGIWNHLFCAQTKRDSSEALDKSHQWCHDLKDGT